MPRSPELETLGTHAAEAAKALAASLAINPEPARAKRVFGQQIEPLRAPDHGRLTREELFAHRDRKYEEIVFDTMERDEEAVQRFPNAANHPFFAPNLADREPIMKADAPDEHWSHFVSVTPVSELADLINATSPPTFAPGRSFTWQQRLAILFSAYGPVKRTASMALPREVIRYVARDRRSRAGVLPPRDIEVSYTLGEGPPTFQLNRLQPGCGKTAISLATAAALMQGDALAHLRQLRAATRAGHVVPSADVMRPVTIVAAAETTFRHFETAAELLVPILSEWYGVPFQVKTSVGGTRLEDLLQPTFWVVPTAQLNRVLRDNALYGFCHLICDEFTGAGAAGQVVPSQRALAHSMTILNATPEQLTTSVHRYGGLIDQYTGHKEIWTGKGLWSQMRASNAKGCTLEGRGMCMYHLFGTPASLVTLVRDSLAHLLPPDLGFLNVQCRYSTLSARMADLDVDIVPVAFGKTVKNALTGFRCSPKSRLVLEQALGLVPTGTAKKARTDVPGSSSLHIGLAEIARVVRALQPVRIGNDGRTLSDLEMGLATRDRVAERLETYAAESCPICCATAEAPAVLSCCGFMACASCVRRHCVRNSPTCPNCRAHLPASVYDERAFAPAPKAPAEPVALPVSDEFLAAVPQEDALAVLLPERVRINQQDTVRQVLRGFLRLGIKKVLVAVNTTVYDRPNLDEFGDCGFHVIRGDPYLTGGRNLRWDEHIDAFLAADQPTVFLLYGKLKQALAGTDRLSALDGVLLVGRQDVSTMEQTIGRVFRPSTQRNRKRCLVVSVRATEF